MHHSRLPVFCGAVVALTLVTIPSTVLGWLSQLVPPRLISYLSAALFVFLGGQMMREAFGEIEDEYGEAKDEIREKEKQTPSNHRLLSFMSMAFIEAFSLTFAAEWGDRSQLTTIVLAAREGVVVVTIGSVLGQAFCTGIAVLGGRFLAQRISVRYVKFIGGLVFIFFAISGLLI